MPRKQSYRIPDSHGSQNAFKDIFLLKVKKSYQIDSSKKSDSKKLNSGILVRKRLKAKGAVYMNIQIKNNTGGKKSNSEDNLLGAVFNLNFQKVPFTGATGSEQVTDDLISGECFIKLSSTLLGFFILNEKPY